MSSKSKKLLIGGIVLVVVVVAVVLVLALRGDHEIDDPDNPNVPINNNTEKSAAEKIVVEPYKLTNPSKNRDVRTSIPEIKSLDDKAFQEHMNMKMLQTVKDYQDEIEIIVDDETPAEITYRYVVSYEKYANDIYLSLVVSNNYQTGGMRSNSWKDTYNINVTKGANKEVFLKDLFVNQVDYKSAILQEINKQAIEKNYELVGGNGLSNLPDEQKFYIKDGSLIIYFDAAAIAPYVSGELEFKMPFTYSDGKFVI